MLPGTGWHGAEEWWCWWGGGGYLSHRCSRSALMRNEQHKSILQPQPPQLNLHSRLGKPRTLNLSRPLEFFKRLGRVFLLLFSFVAVSLCGCLTVFAYCLLKCALMELCCRQLSTSIMTKILPSMRWEPMWRFSGSAPGSLTYGLWVCSAEVGGHCPAANSPKKQTRLGSTQSDGCFTETHARSCK